MSKGGPPPEVYNPAYPPEYAHHPQYQPHHGGQQYLGVPPAQPGPQFHNTFAPVTSQASNQNTNVTVNMGGQKGANRRDWSTQLCGCMEDFGGCCCVCLFTPCVMCSLATRMGECVLLPYVVPQALMAMRVKLREANKIKGTIFMDCVTTSCCPLLSMCQMKREMDNIDKRKPGTEL